MRGPYLGLPYTNSTIDYYPSFYHPTKEECCPTTTKLVSRFLDEHRLVPLAITAKNLAKASLLAVYQQIKSEALCIIRRAKLIPASAGVVVREHELHFGGNLLTN